MNELEAALRRASDDLEARGARWALIGGFAVSARTEPRFTRDVDLALAVDDDAAAEALVRSLMDAGYGLITMVEQTLTDRLATVRMVAPLIGNSDIVVDLLFASSGIEREITDAAEHLEIVPGLTLPIATTGHLIALKLLARDDFHRPQDAADLRLLAAAASPEDLQIAGQAVELIEARGFNRDRNLAAALRALIAGTRGTSSVQVVDLDSAVRSPEAKTAASPAIRPLA